MMGKHPLTDDETEFNSRCQKCLHGIFNRKKGGRKNFNVGKCSVKGKFLVSSIPTKKYDCDFFKIN